MRSMSNRKPISLDENPFSFQIGNESRLRILYHGKIVTTLKGKQADKIKAKLMKADLRQQQKILAIATGNFKR